MGSLEKWLKASTLLETIVAMVIIMICSGIGFDLFTGISHNMNNELRIEAEIKIISLAAETRYKREFTDISLESKGLRVERTFTDYQDKKGLKVLHIEAFNMNGEKICAYREIIELN